MPPCQHAGAHTHTRLSGAAPAARHASHALGGHAHPAARSRPHCRIATTSTPAPLPRCLLAARLPPSPHLDLLEQVWDVLVVKGQRAAQQRVQDHAAGPHIHLGPRIQPPRDDLQRRRGAVQRVQTQPPMRPHLTSAGAATAGGCGHPTSHPRLPSPSLTPPHQPHARTAARRRPKRAPTSGAA